MKESTRRELIKKLKIIAVAVYGDTELSFFIG